MFNYENITPKLGIEFTDDPQLSKFTDSEVNHLNELAAEYGVVVARNQAMTMDQQAAFAHKLGTPLTTPINKNGVPDELIVIKANEHSKRVAGEGWHSDVSSNAQPPGRSMLRMETVPESGGDTLFANMYLAYESLSDNFKNLISSLSAVNSAEKPDAAVTRVHRIAEKPKNSKDIVTRAIHPIVRTHPKTGRKALYCSAAHSLNLEGMSIKESSCILEYLYSVQQREEFSCRYKWKKGSLAFWDNRCAQHNALNDYHGYRRVMHRVTHEGDIPS